jgi:D-alanyl-D-alanine carboxypeptidase
MNKILSLIFFICVSSISSRDIDQAKLDQYLETLETLETHEKAMLSLAVIENGKLIYQKTIGFADADS